MFVLLACGNSAAFAAAKTFTYGGTNNNWSTANNWDGGTVPIAADTVTIPNGQTCIVTAAPANPSTVDVQGSLTINTGVTLTASGTVTISGTVTLSGTGTFTITAATALSITTSTAVVGGTGTVNCSNAAAVLSMAGGTLTTSSTPVISCVTVSESGTSSLDLSSGGTLRLRALTGTPFPSTFDTLNLVGGTVEYEGTFTANVTVQTQYGGGSQIVYGNLIIDNGAASTAIKAVTPGGTTLRVDGTLTIDDGVFAPGDACDLTHLTIDTGEGETLEAGSYSHTLSGNLSCGAASVITPGTSTFTLDGGDANINAAGKSFNHLIVDAPGFTKTLTGALDVDGDVTVTMGTFSLGDGTAGTNKTLTLTDASTLTVVFGATLRMLGFSAASPSIVRSDTSTSADGYTFIISGTINAKYYQVLNPGANGMEVRSGATVTNLDDGVFDYPCDNGCLLNFTGNGAVAPAVIYRCAFNASGSPTGTITNVKADASTDTIGMSGFTGSLATDATVGENNDDDPSNKITWNQGDGMWTGAVSTDWSDTGNWGAATLPTSNIDVRIPTTPSGGNFPVLTAAGDCRNLVLEAGATLGLSSFTLNVNGDWNNQGTLNGDTGTVFLQGTGSWTISAEPNFNALQIGNGTYTMQGNVTCATLYHPAATTLNVGGNTLTVNGNFTRAAVATILTVGSGGRLVLKGLTTNALPDFTLAQTTFDPTSTIEYAGAGAQTVRDAYYGHLVLSGSGVKSTETTTYIRGNLDNQVGSGSFSGSHTVYFDGTGTQTITGDTTFYNLFLDGTNNTLQTGANITITNRLTIRDTMNVTGTNTISVPNEGVYFDVASGTLNVNNGSVVCGQWLQMVNAASTLNIANGLFQCRYHSYYTSWYSYGTINITGTGTFKTVNLPYHEIFFGTVNITGAGNYIAQTSNGYHSGFGGTVNVDNSGALIDIDANLWLYGAPSMLDCTGYSPTIRIGQDFYGPTSYGQFLTGQSTVEFYGTATSNMYSNVYHNLKINKATSGTTANLYNYAITVANDLTIQEGTFNCAGYNITVKGNWTNQKGASNYTESTATVTFDGTANATVSTETFYNLTVNKTGGATLTASGPLTAVNNATLASGTLNTGSQSVNVGGNFDFSGGVYQPTDGTVTLDGTTAPTTLNPGATNWFNHLTINKGLQTRAVTLAGNMKVNGDLTVTLATLSIGDGTSGSQRTVTFTDASTFRVNATATLTARGYSPVARVVMQSDTASPSDGFTFIIDGAVNAKYYRVYNPDADGVQVRAGSTVTSLDYGEYNYPTTNGTLLNFSGNGAIAPVDIWGLVFNASGGATGVTNVRADSSTDTLDMSGYGGSLAPDAATAEANDDDPSSKITWSEVGFWTGTVSTDWSNAANWGASTLPTSTIDVRIPTTPSGGNFPVLTAEGSCKSVTIETGATLGLSSFTLNVYGNWSNAGTLSADTGTVFLQGTGSWIISAEPNFNALQIGNGTYTLQGNLTCASLYQTLTSTFDVGANTLTVNGNYTENTAFNNYFKIGAGGRAVLKGLTTNALPDFSLTDTTFNPTSTVEYAGAGAQTVRDAYYGNLTLSGSGVKSLETTTYIRGNLDNQVGTGSFAGSQTVYFDGSGTQTITGDTTFYQVFIDGANNTVTTGSNLTFTYILYIRDTLTFTGTPTISPAYIYHDTTSSVLNVNAATVNITNFHYVPNNPSPRHQVNITTGTLSVPYNTSWGSWWNYMDLTITGSGMYRTTAATSMLMAGNITLSGDVARMMERLAFRQVTATRVSHVPVYAFPVTPDDRAISKLAGEVAPMKPKSRLGRK
ncbi:MAG: hypothetical protein HY719_05175, partial [Planctomycetes bacterium]|nr:hypothetical protein [Planctomycetota bacterium]